MTETTTTLQIDDRAVRAMSSRLGEPEWLLEKRLAAQRAFNAMTMPSGFEEEWRRTDISKLDLDGALSYLAATSHSDAAPIAVHADGWGGGSNPPVLDGFLQQEGGETREKYWSERLSRRVVFSDLSTAAREHPSIVQSHLGTLVPATEWKLQGLAAAMWTGGAFVYVPRGVEVELPLRYVTLGGQPGAPLLNHIVLVAEEGSGVTLIREASSPDSDRQSLVSEAVEIFAGPGARVRFYDIQRWGKPVYSFSTIRGRLEKGASLTVTSIGLGARLARSRIDAVLAGEGAEAQILGLSFGDGDQHFDYQTLQDHEAPKTVSDLLFKAALAGSASEVWNGTVRIQKPARGSDANQTSRNLLLSEKAKAAPIPVLEIEQYDVLRCSHGATAGPIDEEQLFYLESRGVERRESEHLLVRAFFHDVLDRVPTESLRDAIELAVEAKLEKAAA